MSRRSALSTRDQIDLVQRRRTRDAGNYSESPVALDIRRLPGAGEGGNLDPNSIGDVSWLSGDIGWMEPGTSWLL